MAGEVFFCCHDENKQQKLAAQGTIHLENKAMSEPEHFLQTKEPEAFLLRALGSSWRQHRVGCQCGALLISRAESELREPAEGLVPYSAGQLHAQNRVPHGYV